MPIDPTKPPEPVKEGPVRKEDLGKSEPRKKYPPYIPKGNGDSARPKPGPRSLPLANRHPSIERG